MLGDISKAENIYIASGYADSRKSIDGLRCIKDWKPDVSAGRGKNQRQGKYPG